MKDRKVLNIQTAINFIENNIDKKLSLCMIAQALNYSKYHLHRMFNEVLGMTIHEYIQRRQLTEAAKWLIFSKKSIIDIAILCGYESQQAFTLVFKEMYKETPAVYRRRGFFYPLQLRFNLYDKEEKKFSLKDIRLAKFEDIPIWLELVKMVISGYPNFNKVDYLIKLKNCIIEKRALILKDGNIAIGIMAFSYETNNIEFWGVHPQYKKENIAYKFLKKLIIDFLPEKNISITTYRENDKADIGYRDEIKQLGFIEKELLIEYGYPTQRFVFKGMNINVKNEL